MDPVFPAPVPSPPESQPGSASKEVVLPHRPEISVSLSSPSSARRENTAGDSSRAAWFLSQAHIHLPFPVAPLPEKWANEFEFNPQESARYTERARAFLASERIKDLNFRAPSDQKRNIFRTKKQKEEVENADNWTFTLIEVGRAFDTLISADGPLEPVGVALAILSHAKGTSLNEIWCHLTIELSPEKKKQASQWKRRSAIDIDLIDSPDMMWLDTIINKASIDYVKLLCKHTSSKSILDRAFGLCLAKNWIPAMTLLLQSGSDAANFHLSIRDQIRRNNIDLARLLLSAPKSMTHSAWLDCLIMERGSPIITTDLLLMCLCTRPELACEVLLGQALEGKNLGTTAIVLAYAKPNQNFQRAASFFAGRVAHSIRNHRLLHSFIIVLSQAGLMMDYPAYREELLHCARYRNLTMLKVLVDSGVDIDPHPQSALHVAGNNLDYEMLELLKDGKMFAKNGARVLKYMPVEVTEEQLIRVIGIFSHRGLAGNGLDDKLVCAIRDGRKQLIAVLLQHPIRTGYKGCRALREALKIKDFETFYLLLGLPCDPTEIINVVPTALELESSTARTEAVDALIMEGVSLSTLNPLLLDMMKEEGELDIELIQLLLNKGAPVDDTDNPATNPILFATTRGQIILLEMFVGVGARQGTLATAVLKAFETIKDQGYDTAHAMMVFLLGAGAKGSDVDRTLAEAVQADQVEIVHLLLKHRANPQHGGGVSYANAIRTGNYELLELLCSKALPTTADLVALLETAVNPKWYELRTLNFLLGCTATTTAVINVLWNVVKMDEALNGHPNLSEIISIFLKHELDINASNGAILSLVIQANDIELLKNMLTERLTDNSLAAAFFQASYIKNRSVKFDIWKTLLEKPRKRDIGQSEALLQETLFALNSGDHEGLQLLLGYKASPNHADGIALQSAVTGGSIEIVNLLLSGNANAEPGVLGKALAAAAASSNPPETRKSIINILLSQEDGRIPACDINKALCSSIMSHPDDSELTELLLSEGAQVDTKFVETILTVASEDVFKLVFSTILSPNTVHECFDLARNTKMDSQRRYWIYDTILRQGDVNNEKLSETLIDSIRLDPKSLDIPKLFLSHGAQVGHRSGAAFKVATQSGNSSLIKLLSQYLVNGVDDATANLAFDHVVKDNTMRGEARFNIYSALLQCTISQASMYKALVQALKRKCPEPNIVYLLLDNGVDPNENGGACFQAASAVGNHAVFTALCKRADLGIVLPKLLDTVVDPTAAVMLFRTCLEESNATITQHDLLLNCMRKFPSSGELMGLLLQHGAPASGLVECTVNAEWGPEQCCLLIWALVSQPSLSNEVLVRLVEKSDAGIASFTTPESKIPAAFLCLLDPERTPVLDALIGRAAKEGGNMLDSTIPGSTLMKMAPYGRSTTVKIVPPFDEADEISLRLAALYLVNFEAYKSLESGLTTNDGTLHLAALLALPDFVKWLLQWHNANHGSEDYGGMTPLALACSSLPDAWFEAATGDVAWKARLIETMKLLLPKTEPSWRHRERLVLHIALEAGYDTTDALLKAMEETLPAQARGKTKHLYTDKAGQEYSPVEYLQTFVEAEEGEMMQLKNCLGGHGLA